MPIFVRSAFAALLSIALPPAYAQSPAIEDFVRRAEINEVSISPTGEYLAIIAPTENGLESQLQIAKLDGTSRQAMRLGVNQHITDMIWSDDYRLVVSKAEKVFGVEKPYATGELMAVNVDAKNQEMLFGYIEDQGTVRGRRKDWGYASVAHVIDSEPGSILVLYTSWDQGEEPDTVVYKVNTHTGARQEVERVKRAAGAIFDQTGELRVLVSLDRHDVPVMLYRPTPGSALVPMPKSLVGYRTEAGFFDADAKTLYAEVSDTGEPSQLYRIDMEKGTREKVAGHPSQDIAYEELAGRKGIPFAAIFDAGKPSVSYIDPTSEWAKLHAGLLKHFPGHLVRFVNFTKDNKQALVGIFSDRNPATYYLCDRQTNGLRLVAEPSPWLKGKTLAQVVPLEFKARDGTVLYSFYTALGEGPKPLVVMPHGGPFGPYDSWGYDTDAQFLASRGYGVLQVNFRGSGGRGQTFEESGWQHWGDLIQDDIADGVQSAISAGLADSNRVCIYGASFGGYSALINPIRNPGMYKCAVGYAGVYELNLLRKTDNWSKSRAGRRSMDRELGTDAVKLASISPALHASKINVPVFLVHGKLDNVAKLDQYKAMESALKAAGKPYETMLAEGEGHGFYNPRNVAEFYRRLDAFLDRNIGTGFSPPAKAVTGN